VYSACFFAGWHDIKTVIKKTKTKGLEEEIGFIKNGFMVNHSKVSKFAFL
jgi:hypothetical protein